MTREKRGRPAAGAPGDSSDQVGSTVVAPGDDATIAIPGGSARAKQPDTLLANLSAGEPPEGAIELPALAAEAYQLGVEVARGGMGRVVRAIDHRLNRVVALKLLLGDSPDLRARFAREARITAGLQHPSIVPIYEAGTWPDGNLAYAMKLVSGESLEAAMNACTSLEERLALLPRFIDVVDAVAYAHSERVVHRDIKPSNIILGEFGETILIDWGVAKSLDGDDEAPPGSGLPIDTESSRLTALGAVVGTPVYMPPEQASGETIDDRADVYALGAVLYHLLAGSLPYTGATPLDVLRRVVLGPPPPLESLDPHIPAELAAVVARAMARERSDRYSAAELAAELRRFTTGKLVAAYHYSARERFVRWFHRHRAPVMVAAAALALLVALATLSAIRIIRERDRAQTSDRRSHALVADQYAEQARILLLAGDRLRALAYLFAAADAGAGGPALDFMLARAAHAVEQKRTDLVGHTGPVPFVAFDADGRIVTASDDGTARIWDAATGRTLALLAGHTAAVNGAALRPDEILTFSNDGTVRTWEAKTGRARRTLTGNRAPVLGARYRDDGGAIATAGQDGMVRVFDAASGRLEFAVQGHAGPARDARFDSLGRIWSCGDDGVVAVWQADGTPVRRFALDRGAAMGIAMDGSRVAVVLVRGAVALFEREGAEPRIIDLGEELHAVVRTSRLPLFAGRRLIVPVNRAVQVVDLDSGRRLFALTGHAGEVSMVAASPDGERLATSAADGSARVWSAADGRLLSILPTIDHVRMVAFSPAGNLLATAGFAGAIVWAPSLDPPNRRMSGHRGEVFSVRFDPAGKHVVSGGEDGTIRLWDVATGRQLAQASSGAMVFHASFDPSGRRIVSADEHGVATLWRGDTLERIATVGEPAAKPLMAAVFTPDGGAIATASDDGFARVVDARTGAVRLALRHTGSVNAVELDPAGRRLVTATQDRTARVWDARTGALLVSIPLDGPGVSATFSPDGRRIMVAARRAARIFDAGTGHLIASLEGHQREVSAARFAANGLAVTSGYDQMVKVWDAETGRELSSFEGHATWVSWIDIDAPGQHIVSADLAGTVVIWSLAGARQTPAQFEQRLGPAVPFAVQNGLLIPRVLH